MEPAAHLVTGRADPLALRAARPADLDALDALLQGAYQVARSYRPRLLDALENRRASTIVAEVDGAVAGMGTLHDYGRSGYIALVGVAPRLQGRGIGRALTAALIRRSAQLGHRTLELEASAAGEPLYHAFGFEPGDETLLLEGPSGSYPPLTDVRLRETERESVAALDLRAFGADRAGMLAGLFRRPERFAVARDPSQLPRGYAALRENVVGPWIAESPAYAAAAFDAARSLAAGEPLRVFVRAGNSAARAIAETRRCRSMFRGEAIERPQRYGLLGFGQG
jgi:N-acetylglutamate synthase-like GNAT family acetyltransferase